MNILEPTLADRRADFTERLILDAAVHLLEQGSTSPEVTARAVAKFANVSERTVFRYFPARGDLLDGIAAAVRDRLDLPAPPSSIEELLAQPAKLFASFEEKSNLTVASLHPEIFQRLLETPAKDRWLAVQKLIEGHAPRVGDRRRRLAAANIRYFLAAPTWHYYRFYFGLSLEDSVSCAETAIRQSLEGLRTPK